MTRVTATNGKVSRNWTLIYFPGNMLILIQPNFYKAYC